jgi:hypothetical protein
MEVKLVRGVGSGYLDRDREMQCTHGSGGAG